MPDKFVSDNTKAGHTYTQCTSRECEYHVPRDFFTPEAWARWFAGAPKEPIEIDVEIFYSLLTGRPRKL